MDLQHSFTLHTVFRIRIDSHLTSHPVSNARTPVVSRGSVNTPSHLQLAMSQHSIQLSIRMETAIGYCTIQAIKAQLYPSDGFIRQNALTNPAIYVTECAYDIMFIKNLNKVTCNTNRHFI